MATKFVNVQISDRELFGVAEHLGGAVWGGPCILAQNELWAAMDPRKRFAAVKKGEDNAVDIKPLSDRPAKLRLSAEGAELLKAILQRPGQPRVMGMLSAAALARMEA